MSWRTRQQHGLIGTHPGDFDRGDGYVPGPNDRRELIRQARDRHARRHVRVRERLEREISRRAA